MLGLLRNIKDSFYFELGSVIIILLAAIIYGVDTFSLSDSISETIAILDYTISIIFITEIFIRMVAERKLLNFFKDPWNSFDFIIVSVSLIPVDAFANILVARIIRVFRILRLITHVQKFKALINAFFNSLPRVFYVMALMFVFFYIYAILGTTFFGDIDPERWGNLFLSLCKIIMFLSFFSKS